MGKNRDRITIVVSILEIANLSAGKTRIMFGANLSFKLLEKYLALVVDVGFVYSESSKFYLTARGREFLRRYKDYAEHCVDAQKLIENLRIEKDSLDLMCKSLSLPSLET